MAIGPQADGPPQDLGSYRHMLDLVSSPGFEPILNCLLANTGARIAKPDHRCPRGRGNPAEWSEKELEEYLTATPLPFGVTIAWDWWFPYRTGRNQSPNWDLICPMEVEGNSGLLIVEGKARTGELNPNDAKRPPTGTAESLANDLSIRLRVSETNLALGDLGIGRFRLSTADHYQLANRLTYLNKLATLGLPTILLYLGWLDSPDWPLNQRITDGSHWQRLMTAYMNDLVPSGFVEAPHRPNGVPMRMIVRSLPASEVSVPLAGAP